MPKLKPFVFSSSVLLGLIFAGSACAQVENSDALKQKILAHARTVSADDYAFTRTVRSEQIASGKTEEHVIVDRWDPSKPADQRWTLVSVNGRDPNADELGGYRKSSPNRRVSNYGRVAEYFGGTSSTAKDAQGRTVFSFATMPKGTVMIDTVDLSSAAKGEAIVNASGEIPFVEQVRFTSTKSTRIKLIAVVEKLEATTRYRLMPNGKPVPAEQVTDMTGSMLGKEGHIRTAIKFSDQRAAR